MVRQFLELESPDTALDAWMGEAIFGWLVEATLAWLERGDPAKDEEFVDRATAGLDRDRRAWA